MIMFDNKTVQYFKVCRKIYFIAIYDTSNFNSNYIDIDDVII